MINNNITNSRSAIWGRLLVILIVFVLGISFRSEAHPSPNSAILLEIQSKSVAVELQLPLAELELAFGQNLTKNPQAKIHQFSPQLKAYILAHFHPTSPDNRPWTVTINDLSLQDLQQIDGNYYQDLTAHLWLSPPTGASNREFTLNYDVIVHQVATHTTLVSVRQDWDTGINAEHPVELGVIRMDIVNDVLPPFKVSQKSGGFWKGFKSIVSLGIKHISEGTDHLLFLLVLLLPIPLLVNQKKWASARSVRQSLLHIFKVVTAFTIGHSITLLFGALGWVFLPSKPIEVLIGVSILVSAIHAIKPIFPNKETYIALGFGLIHGLAFAYTLQDLNLSTSKMALSILGFNIGIELMQLAVIVAVIPWLLLLSRTSFYRVFRVFGAILAGIAASGWIVERLAQTPNFITILIEKAANYAVWLLGILMIVSVISYFFKNEKSNFLAR